MPPPCLSHFNLSGLQVPGEDVAKGARIAVHRGHVPPISLQSVPVMRWVGALACNNRTHTAPTVNANGGAGAAPKMPSPQSMYGSFAHAMANQSTVGSCRLYNSLFTRSLHDVVVAECSVMVEQVWAELARPATVACGSMSDSVVSDFVGRILSSKLIWPRTADKCQVEVLHQACWPFRPSQRTVNKLHGLEINIFQPQPAASSQEEGQQAA